MQNNIFPWQQAVWHQCKGMRSRLPHAVLLHGCTGIGKFQFARALSQSLLCATPTADGHACGACQSCHWFQENAHPDFRLLTPEIEGEFDSDTETTKKKAKKKTNIAISQVRDLNDFMHLTGHQAHGYRVILVHPAETLNLSSANALLKMLEEPTENVIFILVAHQIHQLLPTILSRCQKIAMPMPDTAKAVDWLHAQGVADAEVWLAYYANAPVLLAQQQTQKKNLQEIWHSLAQGAQLDPAGVAAQLFAAQVEFGLNTLQKWLYDLISLKSGCEVRYHLTHVQALQRLAARVNLNSVFEMQKKVMALKNLAFHPLNHALQIECLLLEYTKLFTAK